MDGPHLPSALNFQDTFAYDAPVGSVFDALWAAPGGKLLELQHIVGSPRSIGHQQQARFAFGGVDLLIIETVTALERPNHLRITQQPDRLVRPDPEERDIPFLDSIVEDLDIAFLRQFGADPAATHIDFRLTEAGTETHLMVAVEVLEMKRINWLRRRVWRRSIRKEVAEIAYRINNRL